MVVVVVLESGVECGSGEMDEYGSREQDVAYWTNPKKNVSAGVR